MQAVDVRQVVARVHSRHASFVSWLVPLDLLHQHVHPRYTVATVAEHPSAGPMGLITVAASVDIPVPSSTHSWVRTLRQRLFSGDASLRSVAVHALVFDNVHWKYTSWLLASYVTPTNPFFARFPAASLGYPQYRTDIRIRAVFDSTRRQYANYALEMPQFATRVELEDTGLNLLHPNTPIADGFDNNESALSALALEDEYITYNSQICVTRLPRWVAPFTPNAAKPVTMEAKGLLTHALLGNKAPLPPAFPVTLHSCWLQDGIQETLFYRPETALEDEHDSFNASNAMGRFIDKRIQAKCRARYLAHRDKLRQEAYAQLRRQ